MKTSPLTRLYAGLGLAFALTSGILFPLPSAFADEMDAKKPMMGGQMMECCQAMKDQKKTMMTEMKAQDVALTAAVAKMNSATGAEKSTQMAAIVTTLVEQRASVHTGMAKMDEQMMDHMMSHMQMGSESMTQRPLSDDIDKKAGNFRGNK